MSKRKREEQARRNRLLILIAVIVVVIVIIVYFVSLGKINLIPEEDEKTKRIRWIDNRLQDLHFEAKSKKELKEKLDEKVKRYFLYTRIALSFLYLAANLALFFWVLDASKDCNDRLSILLNYNEVAIIVILVILFIRFETPSEFRDVFKLIHLSVMKIVYKNHEELDAEINAIHTEIEVLTKEKDGLSNQEPPADDNNPPKINS
ncbi:MAG: hypothetical protein HND27_07100 [Bacteroidetes bacterium]|nr:hypothetical protein [Bacteroidota bacterium]NOG95532.1 hypothetical protein [Bacteroidota bacterium]GIK70130.1 MAG: hypothetical protein BroJett020_14250 [Bacteroidota bacterium]